MWMTEYIQEIQKKLITEYKFEKGSNGCPMDVPDGSYPMIIDDKLDLVMVVNGFISCCNFIDSKKGLKEFRDKNIESRERNKQKVQNPDKDIAKKLLMHTVSEILAGCGNSYSNKYTENWLTAAKKLGAYHGRVIGNITELQIEWQEWLDENGGLPDIQ